MSTPAERLKQIIKDEGLTPRKWALDNNVPYNNLMQIFKGNQPFGMTLLEKTLEIYPNIDTNWLIKGTPKNNTQPIYDTNDAIKILSEPEMDNDYFEIALLKYLDKPSVQNKLREIFFKKNK